MQSWSTPWQLLCKELQGHKERRLKNGNDNHKRGHWITQNVPLDPVRLPWPHLPGSQCHPIPIPSLSMIPRELRDLGKRTHPYLRLMLGLRSKQTKVFRLQAGFGSGTPGWCLSHHPRTLQSQLYRASAWFLLQLRQKTLWHLCWLLFSSHTTHPMH